MWQVVQQNVLFYGAVAAGFLGVISQVILRMVYGRILKDMENPGTPKGKYVKQLKQKYNIYKRTQTGPDSINIFIQKSMMDYKYLGMHLHTWRRMGGMAFVLCAAFGIGGWYLSGLWGFEGAARQNYLWVTAGGALLIAAAYGITDTGYWRQYIETGLRSIFTNSVTQAVQEVDLSEEPVIPKKKATVTEKPVLESRRKRGKRFENQAQREKQELKENLARLKEGISETAAETEHNKERNSEILKQMDPSEQERIIREVLKEFLS